jgi:glycosyltransferase involved in cell wall biosynthesis
VRILVISQHFWPESFRINELVSSLVMRGIEVDVMTGKPNYPEGNIFTGYRAAGCSIEVWRGARLHRVPIVPRGQKSAHRLVMNYLSFVFTGIIFGTWMLRRAKPDVIFVYATSPILQALPALFLARLKGCPVVLWVQDLWPESLSATGYIRSGWILRMVARAVCFIYKRSDLILLSSRSFEHSVQLYAPDQIAVYYPNSVDISCYGPNVSPRFDLEALKTGFTVVFAGNVGIAQSVETIIEAADKLRDLEVVRFLIFGSGSRLDWMKAEINRRQLHNVFLAGRYPAEAMPCLLTQAKVLLVTLADQAIFAKTVPIKVQTYMAVGRPIIGCLNGEGAQLILDAGAGVVMAAEDAVGLANAVRYLYNLPSDELEAMGASGKRYFREHFDHEMLVDRLIMHFRDLVGEEVDVK